MGVADGVIGTLSYRVKSLEEKQMRLFSAFIELKQEFRAMQRELEGEVEPQADMKEAEREAYE